jgi:aminoglycoside phosphotransferase (APT) family kinase protein
LQCTLEIGDLALDDVSWWGDVLRDPPVRADSWHDYLYAKAHASLRAAGRDFGQVDARSLANELPPAEARSFVHLDAFPGNVLAVGSSVTAVIDLGATAAAGDCRIDPLSAAVYLTPAITPTANDRDRDVAHSWLRNAGLAQHFGAAQRWLAAYWSFAVDDLRLSAWCRSVLL